ncbi:MAG: DsbA family oxidoreductase [Bacteroidales bacterium]|nr:DsbA family oxidoreductase [Bacteroidales bacterium]
MMTLTIWSDFACPYCYIGETRLQKAIEELGLQDDVRVDFRAFELDPTAPKEVTTNTPERFAAKYRLSLEGAKKQIEEISQLGRELGIDFRYATTQYSNTRDAHRLMKLAEAKYDRDTVGRLNEALFAAYFTENLVLSDHEVLLAKGVEAGMDEKEIREVLESDKYDDEVRLDEREAAMRGVRGVPYIDFGGHFAVPGAMTVEGFRSALERELKRQQKENEDFTGERPHACGPDGCQLL